MRKACLLLALLLAACTQEEPAPPPEESISEKVLVDFGEYTFKDADAETATNLEGYIRRAMPEGVEIVDVTVRSVHEDGEPAEAEILAAKLDRGDLTRKQFYLRVLDGVAPGRTVGVLQDRGVMVEAEGTTTVTTFVHEDVMLYLAGVEDDVLLEVADGLLRLNA